MTQPYADYREFEVYWLGNLPIHWQVVRLKNVSSYSVSSVDKKITDQELPVRLCNYTDVYYRDRINASDGEFMVATASSSEVASFCLKRGDVLITKDSEDWQDIAIPALVEEVADDFVCGYHIGIARPDAQMDPQFLFRSLQSGIANHQLQVAATGVTRYGLPNAAVSELVLPLPPSAEQRAIAAFLDHETDRIDRLVVAKRLLIERLEEYRTALISRTVTRGLPPEAASAAGLAPSPPLKPSGVEWLADVPAHWQVKRLKLVASINDESLSDNEDPLRPVSYVDIGSVDSTIGIKQIEEMVFEDAPTRARRLVRDGDTIISTVRTYLRAIAAVHKPAPEIVVSTGFAVVRPREMDPTFAYWALSDSGLVDEIVARSIGVSYPAINAPEIGLLPIPVPPLDEQRAIAEFLDRETARIGDLISRVETTIERLQEYRAALITAAVTGRIDVRGEVVDEIGDGEFTT